MEKTKERGKSQKGKCPQDSSLFAIHCVKGQADMWEELMPRCFITGELCPHRKKIINRKVRNHEQNEITIFMIMDYSDISDAIYEWLMEDLIKNDDIVFKLDKGGEAPDNGKLQEDEFLKEDDPHLYSSNGKRRKIFKKNGLYIELIRADDYSSSSHVICESVCARIQEADMVIADVSKNNPNVFYELGLAVALNKKILPICYQDSYYEEVVAVDKEGNKHPDPHGIYSFPWKEQLYKSFSINSFEEDGNYKEYRLDDKIYGKPPYDKRYASDAEENGPSKEIILKRRAIDLFNDAVKNWDEKEHKTRTQRQPEALFLDNLMLYTLNHFNQSNINKYINNYRDCVVRKIHNAMKSPGDRICLLHLNQKIEQAEKSSAEKGLKYSFGDICGLAINQITYEIDSGQKPTNSTNTSERFMMNYLYNRVIKAKIEYPIDVDLVEHRYFKELGILTSIDRKYDKQKDRIKYFSHLDVFLAYISSCNTAFIDLRSNSIEAFFWLGVLHGSGRLAVPLRHTSSIAGNGNAKRDVIDIAGLWNAYFVDYNPDTFKKGIRSVLHSIYEKRGHLKYNEKMLLLRAIEKDEDNKKANNKDLAGIGGKAENKENGDKGGETPPKIEVLDSATKRMYESFFQKKFWSEMMLHGNVDICPTPVERDSQNAISHWEYSAINLITNYINGFNHVNDLEFMDTLEKKKLWENGRLEDKAPEEAEEENTEKTKGKNPETMGGKAAQSGDKGPNQLDSESDFEKYARIYLHANPKSRIVLGDRFVNKISKIILENYEQALCRMKRCDQCHLNDAGALGLKNGNQTCVHEEPHDPQKPLENPPEKSLEEASEKLQEKPPESVPEKTQEQPKGEPPQSHYRGFYLPNEKDKASSKFWDQRCDYYTQEYMKAHSADQELIYHVLGHLMIFRNCILDEPGSAASKQAPVTGGDAATEKAAAEKIADTGFTLDTGYISVVLEGSSGPGTREMARLMTETDFEGEKNNVYFFLTVQEELLKKYKDSLEKLLYPFVKNPLPSRCESGEFQAEQSEEELWLTREYIDSIVKYLISNLCNCFLPVITNDFLNALKSRAWCFLHTIRGRDREFGQKLKQLELLYQAIEKWIDGIMSLRCTEVVIDMKVSSHYGEGSLKDSRKVLDLTILTEMIRTLTINDRGRLSKEEACPSFQAK